MSGDLGRLDLGGDLVHRLALGDAEVRKEHESEAGVPEQLVDRHLRHGIDTEGSEATPPLRTPATLGPVPPPRPSPRLTPPRQRLPHLGGDGDGLGAGQLRIEKPVEVVARGAVD